MRLAIILAILLPASAWAQWPTNWPMGDYQGRTRAINVYSALVERALAAGVSTNGVLPPGTFTQRRRLVEYKTFFGDTLAPQFVNLSQTNSAGQYFETNSDAVVNMYTASSIVLAAGVTTNYLSRTPMFNLGSDTNYGWIPFKALCNQALWTKDVAWSNAFSGAPYIANKPPLWRSVDPESSFRMSSNLVGAYLYILDDWVNQVQISRDPDTTNDLANAWSWNLWTTNVDAAPLYEFAAWSEYDPPPDPTTNMGQRRTGAQAQATNVYSGVAHAADVVARADITTGTLPTENLAYTNLEVGTMALSDFAVVASLPAAATNWRVMARTDIIAYTNLIYEPIVYNTAPPTVFGGFLEADMPAYKLNMTNQPVGSGWGMKIGYPTWIFRWNVTNGFKYIP